MTERIIAFIFVILLFTISCTNNQYVCKDGRTVSDQSLCFEQFTIYMDVWEELPEGAFISSNFEETSIPAKKLTLINNENLDYATSNRSDAIAYPILVIYTYDYIEENIICDIEEYYDSNLNGKITRELAPADDSPYNNLIWASDIKLETGVLPDRVHYIASCKGLDSGYTTSNTFYLDINYISN